MSLRVALSLNRGLCFYFVVRAGYGGPEGGVSWHLAWCEPAARLEVIRVELLIILESVRIASQTTKIGLISDQGDILAIHFVDHKQSLPASLPLMHRARLHHLTPAGRSRREIFVVIPAPAHVQRGPIHILVVLELLLLGNSQHLLLLQVSIEFGGESRNAEDCFILDQQTVEGFDEGFLVGA